MIIHLESWLPSRQIIEPDPWSILKAVPLPKLAPCRVDVLAECKYSYTDF